MQKTSYGYHSNSYQRRRMRPGRFNRRRRSFDPSFLVRKAVEKTPEAYVSKHAFVDFSLCDQLKKNIKTIGYENPTPIQDQVIPLLIEGKDVIGIARSGTGKTAAFLMPLINKVYKDRSKKVLVVAPTRELAIQIGREFKELARQMHLFSVVCIGGVSIGRQISGLRKRPNFVIGTPGRLKDLDQRRVLHFSDYSAIVLDEVDRMLDMGFMPDVKHIISRLPQPRQSLFFSATLPDKMRSVARDFLKNPVSISIRSDRMPANIDQDIIKVNGKVKIELLHELLIQEGFNKVLVFGRTKRGIEKLARALRKRGFRVASIHGNKTQNQRQRALEQFRNNRIKVLLATDIASRGLDIDNVTHVINYDLPESYEDYIHRIGRTGRMDKKGTALTFIE